MGEMRTGASLRDTAPRCPYAGAGLLPPPSRAWQIMLSTSCEAKSPQARMDVVVDGRSMVGG